MAIKRICLDTSAYSHFKAGHAQTIEIVSQCKSVCIPAIVLGELRAGFRLGKKAEKNEAELRAFLSSPVVDCLDVDGEASILYADIFLELRRKGTPIPTNDIWIAAIAAREGATVLSFDKHFEFVPQVARLILN